MRALFWQQLNDMKYFYQSYEPNQVDQHNPKSAPVIDQFVEVTHCRLFHRSLHDQDEPPFQHLYLQLQSYRPHEQY